MSSALRACARSLGFLMGYYYYYYHLFSFLMIPVDPYDVGSFVYSLQQTVPIIRVLWMAEISANKK